jgi:hypothetical protein
VVHLKRATHELIKVKPGGTVDGTEHRVVGYPMRNLRIAQRRWEMKDPAPQHIWHHRSWVFVIIHQRCLARVAISFAWSTSYCAGFSHSAVWMTSAGLPGSAF